MRNCVYSMCSSLTQMQNCTGFAQCWCVAVSSREWRMMTLFPCLSALLASRFLQIKCVFWNAISILWWFVMVSLHEQTSLPVMSDVWMVVGQVCAICAYQFVRCFTVSARSVFVFLLFPSKPAFCVLSSNAVCVSWWLCFRPSHDGVNCTLSLVGSICDVMCRHYRS